MTDFGLFGGTFDPIHFGHIHLALELAERHNLAGVFFCPAAVNPEKTDSVPQAGLEDRLNMVNLAIEAIPSFSLLTWECHQPPPSYTVDTLRKLHDSFPEVHWKLLLGFDSAINLEKWKEPNEILKLATPLIGARSGFDDENLLKKNKIVLNQIPLLGISSTMIRQRLKQKLYCGHLIPQKVMDYIFLHNLYC